MRTVTVLVAIATAVLIATPVSAIYGTPISPFRLSAVNGGMKCAGCTLLVGLVSQTAQIKNVTADVAMDDMCSYLPYSAVRDVCKLGVALFGGDIAPLIAAGETPDDVCLTLKFCDSSSGQTCRLFPAANTSRSDEVKSLVALIAAQVEKKQATMVKDEKFNICSILPSVCKVENHLPAFDADNDTFSRTETLRGSYWRGKDCNDNDATVFPGRQSRDAATDENCNGIWGVDPAKGESYEDEYCSGTGALGVAALGDSATAHFRLPPDYFTASELSSKVFANLLRELENEGDWPMLSWSTGHLNASDFAPDVSGPTDSVYLRLRAHNLCNHRDYANLGVNGARSAELVRWDELLNRDRRNASRPVKPLLVIMSMIGNDVCSGHHTFDTMTTAEEYRANVLAALKEADSFLPNGSHVVLIPLVDGRILFDTMADRIHPIGSTNKDVTYTNLYDYLNCLDVSPCWGWMNSNATVRNVTWAHAQAMNEQLPIIAKGAKYEHISVHFFGNVFDDALNSYTGPKWELIEPVDGFHPSQRANALLGAFLFDAIKGSGILGPVNPNNAIIKQKFGNQGGY